MKAGLEDNLAALDFTKDGQSLFLITSIGTDTARLVRHEIASGIETVIARSDDADLSDVMIHPTLHIVQAAAFDPGRKHWTVARSVDSAGFRRNRENQPTEISPSLTATSPIKPGSSRSSRIARRRAITRGIAQPGIDASCSVSSPSSTTPRSLR